MRVFIFRGVNVLSSYSSARGNWQGRVGHAGDVESTKETLILLQVSSHVTSFPVLSSFRPHLEGAANATWRASRLQKQTSHLSTRHFFIL